MLKIYYGEDRLGAEKAVKRELGEGYEVFEGESLAVTDLPSVFRGTSLFETEKRRILLKDVGENTAVWEKAVDYLDTEHAVVIWEMKLDKRSAGYKRLKDAGAMMLEFPAKKKPEINLVFNILDAALNDGERAVKMVGQIEMEQDPYMFFGLMVTQALKKYDTRRAGRRERELVKELARVDMQMKTTAVEPWTLIKSCLLRIKDCN